MRIDYFTTIKINCLHLKDLKHLVRLYIFHLNLNSVFQFSSYFKVVYIVRQRLNNNTEKTPNNQMTPF